jgi:hypothetical protein
MALNVGVDVSFDDNDWIGIREEAGEVSRMESYVRRDDISR